MSAGTRAPVITSNPHWLPGESSAEHARRRGWDVGTRLVGDEGFGPTTITITGLGLASVLAVVDGRPGESLWTLEFRDWQLAPSVDRDGSR